MQELASRADARTQVIEPINNADGDNADGVFRVVISGTSADIGKAERRGELALQGIVPSQLTTDTFVGPLTAEQQILLAQTGRLYDENAAAQAAQLGGQNQLATFPALAFASVGTAPLGPLVGAAGTRVLVGLGDLGAWLATRAAAALGAAAADVAAFGVGVLGGVGIGLIMHAPQTGGGQSITDLGNGQRFIKMGDMRTGELQERNALGEWQTVENGYGVTLYVIGGQRVVLTPEEAAKFRPVPSPMPEPQGPPILPGAPIPVPTKPDDGGFQVTPPVVPGVEIYPVADLPSWEDLLVTSEGDPRNNGVYTPSRTTPTGQLGGTALGERTSKTPNAEADNKADIDAENNALDVVANDGYKTERNPVLTAEERAAQGLGDTPNPDARIEGRVFDVKASKTPQSAESKIKDSVNQGQSRRFIISTDNFANPDVGARELAARLRKNPIPGLQEVKVIVNGVLRNIYP
jgi:hypothetical protein